MWAYTRNQDYGLNGGISIEEMYIQFQDENDKKVSFTFRAPSDSTALDEKVEKDEDISPLFKIAKESKQTMVNYASLDIASETKRVVTVAHPILVDGIVEGVVFWEYDLAKTFAEIMIPQSFVTSKSPFV